MPFAVFRVVAALTCSALLLIAASPPSARAESPTRKCGSMVLGVARISKIRATGVSCRKAKRLLNKATLDKNRHGADFWYFGRWAWSTQGLDEMSSRIRGRRGDRRITAILSAT